ncbi:MAG: DUF1080 domain-containing protein [Limisphaerales bacterium]
MQSRSRFAMRLASLGLIAALPLLAQESRQPVVEGTPTPEPAQAHAWHSLFDGKTLSGWKTFDPGGWSIDAEGNLVGKGPRSHLFSPKTYKNLEFKAEAKLNHKGNSGMYFRTKLMPGWPNGYESQVENTSSDPQRTGSLYNRAKNFDQLIPDDTWWTQHIVAIGNRIIIKVNDKIIVDFVDEKRSFLEGHVALQQHDPGSVVHYRNVMVKTLPDDEAAALAIAKTDMPDIGAEPHVKTRK